MLLEDENGRDIGEFVHAEWERLASELPSIRHANLNFVREAMVIKSQGVFLWAKLVFLEIETKAHEEGCTVAETEQILDSIRAGLDSFYDQMHSNISAQPLTQLQETPAIFT